MSTSAPMSMRKDAPLAVVGEDMIRACLRGDESLVKNLVDVHGQPIVDFTSEDHGKFPLMVAVLQSNESLARLLIKLGANVNQKTAKGRPALPAAIARDNIAIVKLLINNGAETEVAGLTLLDLCKSSEMREYIASLSPKEVAYDLDEDTLFSFKPVVKEEPKEEPKEVRRFKDADERKKLLEIEELKRALSKRLEPKEEEKVVVDEPKIGAEGGSFREASSKEDDEKRAEIEALKAELRRRDEEKAKMLEDAKEKKRLELLEIKRKKEERRRKEEEELRAEERRKAEEEAEKLRKEEEAEKRRKEAEKKKRDAELAKEREIERLKELLEEKKKRRAALEEEARKDKEIQILRMKHMLLEKEERKREEAAAKLLELEKLKKILAVKKELREKERERRKVEAMMAKYGKGESDMPEKTYIIVEEPPNWHAMGSWGTSYVEATCFEFIPPSSLEDIMLASTTLRCKKTTRRIKLKVKPFAKGSERAAFFMHDETTNEKLVAKEYFKVNDYDSHYEAAELQTVARAFAKAFNAMNPLKEVHFIPSNIYHIPSRLDADNHVSVEMWVEGTYDKFNNNFGNFAIGDSYSATSNAFSHFTYQASGGKCIIVDIQGVKRERDYYYTDPAIHTVGKDLKFEFHGTNFGQEGMDRFFLTHTCNQVCKRIGLKQHPKQPTTDYLSEGTVIPF